MAQDGVSGAMARARGEPIPISPRIDVRGATSAGRDLAVGVPAISARINHAHIGAVQPTRTPTSCGGGFRVETTAEARSGRGLRTVVRGSAREPRRDSIQGRTEKDSARRARRITITSAVDGGSAGRRLATVTRDRTTRRVPESVGRAAEGAGAAGSVQRWSLIPRRFSGASNRTHIGSIHSAPHGRGVRLSEGERRT